MNRPRICATIINDDLPSIKKVVPLVDLFEVRFDLIGEGWQRLVPYLGKPWIACNRRVEEGGYWQGSEPERVAELLKSLELGGDIIDIELATGNLEKTMGQVKKRSKCLLSYHNLKETPSLEEMRTILRRQLAAGADICKLVTTARRFEDNLSVLQLISDFPQASVVAFAMGNMGVSSRILCPLVGGNFIYASIEEGKKSAPGQITVANLSRIYRMLRDEK